MAACSTFGCNTNARLIEAVAFVAAEDDELLIGFHAMP
jgi:hypothetical protein